MLEDVPRLTKAELEAFALDVERHVDVTPPRDFLMMQRILATALHGIKPELVSVGRCERCGAGLNPGAPRVCLRCENFERYQTVSAALRKP